MTKWSPRAWVLGGFTISLASVVLNTVVLNRLNAKLASASAEYSAVKESMGRMATEIQRAENKYELVRVFHWVAMSLPEKQRDTARQEAAYVLMNYLRRFYAAVHDIPPIEVIQTEMTELEDDYEGMRKIHDILEAYKKADPKEQARLEKELDAVDADAVEVPTTPLGLLFKQASQVAEAEATAEDESELLLAIAPKLQSLRAEFIKLYQAKANRLKELEATKVRLVGQQALTSYLAIGLQLLGLFFILSRDVVKDINDKKKAEAAKTA